MIRHPKIEGESLKGCQGCSKRMCRYRDALVAVYAVQSKEPYGCNSIRDSLAVYQNVQRYRQLLQAVAVG